MKKTISILGQRGFIGGPVRDYLKRFYNIIEDGPCEVLVNCAGFAKMYESQKNPSLAWSVESLILDRIKHVQFEYLIHISSIYIETNPKDNYALFKRAMECILQAHYPNSIMLRVVSVLGRGLKKNVVFDLVNDLPLWATSDSVYNYISIKDLAEIIHRLIKSPRKGILNVGASESVTVSDIASVMGKFPVFGEEYNHIVINVSGLQDIFPVKTSKQYVQEYYQEDIDEKSRQILRVE